MTHIVIISGSNRSEAQSHRVGEIYAAMLKEQGASVDHISMRDVELPLWDEGKWSGAEPWPSVWAPVSERLKKADGFVVITPEWHGMASPQTKNFLTLCDGGELAFKPAHLVSVSSGTGGAYPIAELRMSGTKNNYLHWLPDHVIIRKVVDFEPGSNNEASPDWLVARITHGIKVLMAYAEAVKPIRENVVDLSVIKTGM
ncbi:MAG: NAD(P)H-dependent oxidoreductase [Neomegalonema sp.]|nr:NAD(P)H-dependent oxidoreductase [Neomegalonema sp.]